MWPLWSTIANLWGPDVGTELPAVVCIQMISLRGYPPAIPFSHSFWTLLNCRCKSIIIILYILSQERYKKKNKSQFSIFAPIFDVALNNCDIQQNVCCIKMRTRSFMIQITENNDHDWEQLWERETGHKRSSEKYVGKVCTYQVRHYHTGGIMKL